MKWLAKSTATLIKGAFFSGIALATILSFVFRANGQPTFGLLVIGLGVAKIALIIILLLRLIVGFTEKYVSKELRDADLTELSDEQLRTVGTPGVIYFFGCIFVLMTGSFAFGWVIISLITPLWSR